MENRFVCRVCEKIEIGTDIYALKTIGYENDAKFDEENNLILTDKKHKSKKEKLIPHALDEEFLKSTDTMCYMDDVNYAYLHELTNESDLEKLFVYYTKELDSLISIVYFDKKLDEYNVLKASNDDLIEFCESSELKGMLELYEVSNLQPLFINDKNVTMGLSVFKKIIDYVNTENLEALRTLLTPEKQITLQTENGVMSPQFCNFVSSENAAKLEKEELKDKTEEEIMEDLNSLVGLDKIKLSIQELKNHLMFVEKSKEFLNLDRPNLNMIFTGNPGTGKTTVAKILSALLCKMGLANDKVFECTAKDFIGGYVGQTAIKANELMQKAKGGILFIDEAYSFVSQGNSFAQEALAEILKQLEKNETIFIFSGYKKEMEEFIKYNSGLTSRIGYYFDFENYNVLQLYEMFEKKLAKTKMVMSEECKPIIIDLIDQATKNNNFGNGRFIDKLFNSIIISHANNTINTDDKEKLITITKEDIKENILEQILYTNIQEKRIGFHN